MPYFAHSGLLKDKSDWQLLPDHLSAVAAMAADFARPFGLEKTAYAMGLFHDLGKYDPAFQRRLEGADIRVDHSTAGAAVLKGLVKGPDAVMTELAAYGILGHHAGLPDRNTPDPGCYEFRLQRFVDRLDPVWQAEVAVDPAGIIPVRLARVLAARDKAKARFDLSVVVRFLFSCLVDADFKETEAYYAGLERRRADRTWPALKDLLPEFVKRFNAHMAAMPSGEELNRLRGDILGHVRANAAMAPGLFTLTVPTGGGKTLASLGFALDHARMHGHRRIVYAIPFTSVIDQVADVFRTVLGGEHVLEHHSAIEEDRAWGEGSTTSRDRMKLVMEDWAAPVVVTTNVQLFESLFAARTSRARKLHNIAGSIIVLDEAQTIPRHLLTPCVRMLDSLAHVFGCTIVLCTATQPALGAPGFPDGLAFDGRELAPDPRGLARRLRRARIERAGPMADDALIDALSPGPQALVIVNSRKHALDLFKAAKDAGLDGLVHLTTRQCAAHRRKILEDVRARLKGGKPCRVVATSLIEAGVDVDFPRVWRAEAGLDSIVQAAGRCNREGRNPWRESVVTVFSAPDHPPPREIAGLVGDMGRMVSTHEGDLLSLDAIEAYFGEVYWRAGPRLDEKKIVDDFKVGANGTDFAFREAARKFRMIESTMVPVIIPIDDAAKKSVHELAVERIPSGLIARKLQSYIVQIPPKARDLLLRNGHVGFESPDLRGDQFAVLKSMGFYTKEMGLLWEDGEYLAVESAII